MMQVCKETGMTYQALKFYCNEGLVPNVKRDVAWISSLTCLKKCGMSIQVMKDYLALCLQGERTIPQRKILLCISAVFHPSATSSTIIRLKPTAKNTVPMLECAPCDISGISSSTTT